MKHHGRDTAVNASAHRYQNFSAPAHIFSDFFEWLIFQQQSKSMVKLAIIQVPGQRERTLTLIFEKP
jgi:hypothetical protein